MSDYTPPTEVIRQAVTFERNRLGEPRTISVEKFERWLAKHDTEVAAKVLTEVAADVESGKPIQDGSEYRQWMMAGIDRALFRIRERATERPIDPRG